MKHGVYCWLHFTGETRAAKYLPKVIWPISGGLGFRTQVPKAWLFLLTTGPYSVHSLGQAP